jgi:E3 ubiquitin-protein ligase TRIP12
LVHPYSDFSYIAKLKRRKEMLLEAFGYRRMKGMSSGQTPFATLVKKLQESLTRMESFDVVTVAQSSDGLSSKFPTVLDNILTVSSLDSKRSSPSLLARQLRLRLVASEDESDVPRNLHNIIVSIHAIATFQALHDYLRPRVAGLLNSGSRLSGMLAALAASASTSRSGLGDAQVAKPSAVPSESSSSASVSGTAPTVVRRRSQRLSAKNASSPTGGSVPNIDLPVATSAMAGTSEMTVSTPGAAPSAMETTPSDTVVDTGLEAEFTDDEIDADMFDDEVDPDNSVSDKTVTLSVVEGQLCISNCKKEVTF